MDKINVMLSNTTLNPFMYKRENLLVLGGNEESLYAWLAANYMTGLFSNAEGMLDMDKLCVYFLTIGISLVS